MLFSVLIPVRNDLQNLRRCLSALRDQVGEDCEVLVGDDGSEPRLKAEDLLPTGHLKLQLFRLEGRGPAAARNRLAERATGRYLFFLDSDTQLLPGSLACARRIISQNSEIEVFFGSYDDSPFHVSPVSLYKNLLHHYIHQKSRGRISTFWSGCGIMSRRLFWENGGFSETYGRPSVEDIELGMRLSRQGVAIYLFPEFQVKHLKRWTLANWLRTDLLRRGIPWVRIMRSNGTWLKELNLTHRQRLSALAALILTGSLSVSLVWPLMAVPAVAALAGFLALNFEFFRLVAAKRGLPAAAAAVPLHLLYALVCIVSILIGTLMPVQRDTWITKHQDSGDHTERAETVPGER